MFVQFKKSKSEQSYVRNDCPTVALTGLQEFAFNKVMGSILGCRFNFCQVSFDNEKKRIGFSFMEQHVLGCYKVRRLGQTGSRIHVYGGAFSKRWNLTEFPQTELNVEERSNGEIFAFTGSLPDMAFQSKKRNKK